MKNLGDLGFRADSVVILYFGSEVVKTGIGLRVFGLAYH